MSNAGAPENTAPAGPVNCAWSEPECASTCARDDSSAPEKQLACAVPLPGDSSPAPNPHPQPVPGTGSPGDMLEGLLAGGSSLCIGQGQGDSREHTPGRSLHSLWEQRALSRLVRHGSQNGYSDDQLPLHGVKPDCSA